MSIQTFKPYMMFPFHLTRDIQAMTIDASGEKAAFVTQVPKTGNIRKVGFRTGGVTTAQTLKVSLQGVDSAGDPDGTIKGPTNNGFGTQASPASNTFYLVTLGEDVSVTYLDPISIVIEFSSTVGNLNIAGVRKIGGIAEAPWHNMYNDLYTTSWAKHGQAALLPSIALEYDDGSYASGLTFPFSAVNALSFNSGSSPDEIGIYFRLPFTCGVIGGWVYADMDQDGTLTLYGDSTVTATISSVNRGSTGVAFHSGFFSTSQTLTKNTWYRLTLKPTTTTPNIVNFYELQVNPAAMMDSYVLGQNCYRTERTDSGAWTETTTQRPYMGLLIDGIDTGSFISILLD